MTPDTVTTDTAVPRTRRIWVLTTMFCVAVVVLAADAISKAQVLAKLPGHPPVRLLDGLITLDLTFNAGAAFGVGHVLHRGHRADRVRRDRLHHPDGPAAAQLGLDDRPRPAPRRRHGQPRRPPVPGSGPAPRPGRGLDQPAPLPVDLQPGRRLDHLRRRHHRHPRPARHPHRRHHPRPRRRTNHRRPATLADPPNLHLLRHVPFVRRVPLLRHARIPRRAPLPRHPGSRWHPEYRRT